MVIILMGVSGVGKTTIGELLAQSLGWGFYDGDDSHPQASIDKMERGIALTDSDRRPWLDRLRKLVEETSQRGESAVVACSALKKSYRDHLTGGSGQVQFVYLRGDYKLIERRLMHRREHFFDVDLLASQFTALEEPEGVIRVNVSQEPGVIVAIIRRELGL